MARRTKDDAEKTKNAILDAAETLFYARGVTCTSLEQIASAANVTRGAVYWHFKDKMALCDAMARRVFLPHEDMLETLVSMSSQTPLKDLKESCVHALTMIAQDKKRREVVTILTLRCEYVAEMAPIVARCAESKDRILVLAEKLFTQAEKLHILAPRWTPRLAASTMQALMMGLITNGLEQSESFEFATTGVACVEAFFDSLQVT